MDTVVMPVLFSYQHLGLWCAMRHVVVFCEGMRPSGDSVNVWRFHVTSDNAELFTNVFIPDCGIKAGLTIVVKSYQNTLMVLMSQ